MAAKHLNSKWAPTFQFKMTDSFLFIAILQISWVKISILYILLNPIVYACCFKLHFHFNNTGTQMNTIVPDLKVSKIRQRGNQHDMHRGHQSHYFYCQKTSRIGSVHSWNIGCISDQFHNAHGSLVLDVYTARISRMQVNWNSYRPRWLCRSLKYREMKSIIERMVPRWSKNTWKIMSFWGGK